LLILNCNIVRDRKIGFVSKEILKPLALSLRLGITSYNSLLYYLSTYILFCVSVIYAISILNLSNKLILEVIKYSHVVTFESLLLTYKHIYHLGESLIQNHTELKNWAKKNSNLTMNYNTMLKLLTFF
jgi:hypothetical protein